VRVVVGLSTTSNNRPKHEYLVSTQGSPPMGNYMVGWLYHLGLSALFCFHLDWTGRGEAPSRHEGTKSNGQGCVGLVCMGGHDTA